MKLVCSQSDLNANLALVSRAVPARPSQPILANVLLTADAGIQRVSLAAFDLTLGIQTSFAAAVETSGAIALPAKLLGDIVSRLPGDSPITLEGDLDSFGVTLVASSGRYQVRGMSAEEFPELPLVQTGEAVHLPPEQLVEGLRGTLFATSGDETKQILTGVHLKVQPEMLEFAATDGHRLAVVQTSSAELASAGSASAGSASAESANAGSAGTEPASAVSQGEALAASGVGRVVGEGFEVTVPGRALRDLERMMAARAVGEAIALYFDQGQTVFQWGDQYLTSRTLDKKQKKSNE